jgi:hypothetical protein
MFSKKKIVLISFTFLFFCAKSTAQTTSLTQLFYPNITIKADIMPESDFGNGQKLGINRTTALGMIPLSTDINVGIGFGKKADIQARHSLIIANLAQINTTIDGKEQPEGGYKTLGFTYVQLKASLREKFWVYALGGGITQSNETFFNAQPYFYGGAARLRIFGLKTQILYGTAIIYSQKFRVIPVFGFTKSLGDDWKISGILPFRASLTYKSNKWLHFDFNGVYDGYSAGYQEYIATEKQIKRQNFQQVKFSVSANAHLLNVFNIGIEGGVGTFRQVKTFNSANENTNTKDLPIAPYLGVSLRYITTKSNVSSKFLRGTGIGL